MGFSSLTRSTTSFSDIFVYKSAMSLMDSSDPTTIQQAQKRPDWNEWQIAINSEIQSLQSRSVFGRIQDLPFGKTIVGYRWVLTRKCTSDNRSLC